ncbi:hypothetical protein EON65_24230 [archaeon]|nr:MAG: hypothetical protein EON65_24230 [archaeon]
MENIDYEALIQVLTKTMELLGPAGVAIFEQNKQKLVTFSQVMSEQIETKVVDKKSNQGNKDKANSGKKKVKSARKPIDMSK